MSSIGQVEFMIHQTSVTRRWPICWQWKWKRELVVMKWPLKEIPGKQPPWFKVKMGHLVRHLLRRDTSRAPVKSRKVRQLLRERDRGGINVSSSSTLHRTKPPTRNLRTPADEDNAGDWNEKERWDVFNRWRCGHKENGTISLETSQRNCKSWRGSDRRQFVLPRESVSESRDRSQVQKASRAVPQWATVKTDLWARNFLAELLFFQPWHVKFGGPKLAPSLRAL